MIGSDSEFLALTNSNDVRLAGGDTKSTEFGCEVIKLKDGSLATMVPTPDSSHLYPVEIRCDKEGAIAEVRVRFLEVPDVQAP